MRIQGLYRKMNFGKMTGKSIEFFYPGNLGNQGLPQKSQVKNVRQDELLYFSNMLLEKLGKIFSKMRLVIGNAWCPMDWLGG